MSNKDDIDVPDDHKLIEFDIDTTNPNDLCLHIICKNHKLDGSDLIDALEHILDKLLDRDKGLN